MRDQACSGCVFGPESLHQSWNDEMQDGGHVIEGADDGCCFFVRGRSSEVEKVIPGSKRVALVLSDGTTNSWTRRKVVDVRLG